MCSIAGRQSKARKDNERKWLSGYLINHFTGGLAKRGGCSVYLNRGGASAKRVGSKGH